MATSYARTTRMASRAKRPATAGRRKKRAAKKK